MHYFFTRIKPLYVLDIWGYDLGIVHVKITCTCFSLTFCRWAQKGEVLKTLFFMTKGLSSSKNVIYSTQVLWTSEVPFFFHWLVSGWMFVWCPALCRTGRWAISRTPQSPRGLISTPLTCTFPVWLQTICFSSWILMSYVQFNDAWESVQSWAVYYMHVYVFVLFWLCSDGVHYVYPGSRTGSGHTEPVRALDASLTSDPQSPCC